MQDQEQNEVWDEDSLFLDLDENVIEKEMEEADNNAEFNYFLIIDVFYNISPYAQLVIFGEKLSKVSFKSTAEHCH